MARFQDLVRVSLDTERSYFSSSDDFSFLEVASFKSLFLSRFLFLTHSLTTSTGHFLGLMWRNAKRNFPRLCLGFLPSLIRCRLTERRASINRVSGLAALDGLRGLACLCVFNYHLLFTYTWAAQKGWGFNEDNRYFVQLPIIRFFYAGHCMVYIFFVLSGYVLSYKALQAQRQDSLDDFVRILSSSVFRRAFRLYVPGLISTFCTMLLVQTGAFKQASAIRNDGITLAGCNEQHPPYYPTLTQRFIDWMFSVANQLDPWKWEVFYGDYDPHLWTIALELKASMVLFLTLLEVCQLRPPFRSCVIGGMIVFTLCCDRWEVFLFSAGSLIAETDPPPMDRLTHALFRDSGYNEIDSKRKRQNDQWRDAHLWIAIFILGLFLGSCPSIGAGSTPFDRFLLSIVPATWSDKNKFWQAIGAILIIWSVKRSQLLHLTSTNALAQYLGAISYSLYLVHGPILHSLGYILIPALWSVYGKETVTGWALGIGTGALILLSICIWIADIWWRMIDLPCVMLQSIWRRA